MLAISATVLAGFLIQPVLVVQQAPPRDPALRQAPAAAPVAREAELAKILAAEPDNAKASFELAKRQEDRGAYGEAEATLQRARQAAPSNREVLVALAGFYNRSGKFEQTIEALQAAAELTPGDPKGFQQIAVYYWDKARVDATAQPAQKLAYLVAGIAAADRAIAIDPNYSDALIYKNILLRLRANLETDPLTRQQYMNEADALRNRAIEINKERGGSVPLTYSNAPQPPPPPPPPGSTGMAPVRVGGTIRTPDKTRDAKPVYPPDAMRARIQGVVILEVTIDPSGAVSDARILRSVPGLDQAAIDAVRQWQYTPTLLNGVAVPVIMTVTLHFALQ